MKNKPYIEPSIRTIAGALLLVCGYFALQFPELKVYWLGFLFFIAFNLFQSGLTRFCLMEKILRRAGFRSEMDEIRCMALHDTLTGLPNRVHLESCIEHDISQASRNGMKVAMLFIDLDNFKQINDQLGHKAGDKLLIKVAHAIRAELRPYDTLARWGGDEFVVLVPDLHAARQAHAVGEKLMHAVAHALQHEQHMHTTLSIGVALYPDDASCTESLLMQADKALYHAKAQGRNNIQLFGEMEEQQASFCNIDISSGAMARTAAPAQS